MKSKIIKKTKKCLKILKSNSFREPFQIIVDHTFLKATNKFKLELGNFKDLLKSEPKFFITKCAFEKYKPNKAIKDFSGQCEIIKCNHSSIESECTFNYIKKDNPHHFILASNSLAYFKKLENSDKIPLIRILDPTPRIECFKMEKNAHNALGEPASSKELKKLKKMFG